MSPLVVSLIGIAIFLLLIFHALPIGFAFAIVGFIGLFLFRGLGPALYTLGNAPFTWGSSAVLIPLPLFILMGYFAFSSGISTELYEAARKWVGRLPGGLAMATTLASTGFAAVSGSTLASAATMGTVAFPEMEQLHYDRRLSTGCIAAGGLLAPLIPPSVGFIVIGVLTETSISKLFMAGIFPGLLLSGTFLATIFVMCKRNPRLGPAGPSFSWRERFVSLKGVWGMLVLFVLIIGGLYLGIFTPSEAGAIGAFGAFVIALAKRRLTISSLLSSVKDAAQITSFIFIIFIGAMIFNSFLSVSGFSTMIAEWVNTLPVSRYVILVAVLFVYLPLGMIMEPMAMVLLTIPVVFPVIVGLGFDPVWFGVLVALAAETSFLTPPVGLNVYVVHGVTKVPLEEIFRGVMPFFFIMIVCIAILIVFPQIVLFIPNMMK